MKYFNPFFLALACAATAIAAVDRAQLAAARALYDTVGKSAEAQQAFETIATADPQCAEAEYFLAQLALRRDDDDKARVYADKAVALAPDSADAQHTFGDAYGRATQKASVFSKLGLAKKSLAAYQRAVELAPANVDFHQSLFDYYRNAPGIAGGGSDKALAEAAIIKKLDANRGRLAFAQLYIADNKVDLAFSEYDEVLKTSPDDYSALYQIGRLAAVSGQALDRGLASLRHCLDLTPPPNQPLHAAAQWRIGNLLEKKNDPAGARAAYEASLKLDPKFSQAADALKKLK